MEMDQAGQKRPRTRIWVLLFVAVIAAMALYMVFAPANQHGVTTSMQRLTDYGGSPLFSPDGKQIAFEGNAGARTARAVYVPRPWTTAVWTMTERGRDLERVGAAEIALYTWAVDAAHPGPANAIVMIDQSQQSSPGFLRRTEFRNGMSMGSQGVPHEVVLAACALDSLAAAFLFRTPAGYSLRVDATSGRIDPSADHAKEVGAADENSRPVWSPDSEYVAWTHAGQISVYSRATKKLTTYSPADGYPGRHISWHPILRGKQGDFLLPASAGLRNGKRETWREILVYEIWSEDPFGQSKPGSSAATKTQTPSIRPGACVGVGWLNVANGDGGVLYKSERGGECMSPVWHPSGKFVTCMTAQDQPFFIGAVTLHKTPNADVRTCLTQPAGPKDRYSDFQMISDLESWLSWSPDGGKLAYGYQNQGIVIFTFDVPNGKIQDLWK